MCWLPCSGIQRNIDASSRFVTRVCVAALLVLTSATETSNGDVGTRPNPSQPLRGCTDALRSRLPEKLASGVTRYTHACQLNVSDVAHWEVYWDPTISEDQDKGRRFLLPPHMVTSTSSSGGDVAYGHARGTSDGFPRGEPLPFAGVVLQTPGAGCVDAWYQAGFVFTSSADYGLQEWNYQKARGRQGILGRADESGAALTSCWSLAVVACLHACLRVCLFNGRWV
jgi:hypothetical protein